MGVCTACCSHCSARLLQPRGARWLLPQCSRCVLLARVRMVCMCMAVHVHVHVKQGQAADQVRVQQCLVINTAELSWRRGYVAPCSNGETSCARASAQEVHAGVNVSPFACCCWCPVAQCAGSPRAAIRFTLEADSLLLFFSWHVHRQAHTTDAPRQGAWGARYQLGGKHLALRQSIAQHSLAPPDTRERAAEV